jgi:starch phosphorylase
MRTTSVGKLEHPIFWRSCQVVKRICEARGGLRLYLLDSNDQVNNPADRGITSELYGGGPQTRMP